MHGLGAKIHSKRRTDVEMLCYYYYGAYRCVPDVVAIVKTGEPKCIALVAQLKIDVAWRWLVFRNRAIRVLVVVWLRTEICCCTSWLI